MPTLTVNGSDVTVREGATILDAARSIGIEVPTLCWYPKLPIVGSCRVCLVSVEGSPKLVAACATTAADGMKVTTEAVGAVCAVRIEPVAPRDRKTLTAERIEPLVSAD